MIRIKGDLSSIVSFRYLWNKKFGIVVGFVCLVIVTHALFNKTSPHDSASSSSSHLTRLQSGTISTDPFRLDSVKRTTNASKKIIVLSYMRSGSTLVGDIIQSHPGVFYVYEPLLYLWDYYVPKKMDAASDLRRRAKTFWKTSKTYIAPPLDFMTYMFNCNLTASNLKFLTNAKHSQVFQNADCPIYRNGMHIVNTSDVCVDRLTKRCSVAEAVLLKVVRLTMAEADSFLENNPDVKIIHLVRDPRGILLSRMHFNDKETGEMHNNYSNICRRILDDLQVSQKISFKHYGKVLTMRYEDLSKNLKGFTKMIFEFIGLSLDPQVVHHLEEITGSQDILRNGKIRAKKTRRNNPYKTAYRWRNELPFSLVKQVDQECKELYKVMGYRHFVTEAELRNDDVSARSRYYGNELMTAVL